MLLPLPDVLDAAELQEARQLLLTAPWTDGRTSAGQQAVQVKNNRQLPHDCDAARTVRAMVLRALDRHPAFFTAALPKRVYTPTFNRYGGEANHYGKHVDNALRFAPAGSAIDIDLDRGADDRLHWTIKDAGPGVPDHEQAYLFEAFFHGLRNRDETGSFGLSLAIASKIMQAHGGSVWSENLPEAGVAFHLHLPGGISDDALAAPFPAGSTDTPDPRTPRRRHPFDA